MSEKQVDKLVQIIYEVVVLLNDLEGGVLSLQNICGSHKVKREQDLVLFVYMVACYGSKNHIGDNSLLFVKGIQRSAAIDSITDALSRITLAYKELKSLKPSPLLELVQIYLIGTESFLQKLDKLLKVVSDERKLSSALVGDLVPLKCGHRGRPNRSEERMLDNAIRVSGFTAEVEELLKKIHDEGYEQRHEDRQRLENS
mmetsp:Transcript_16137/g.11650  ORF Transcript_16137/g.11650 Transcript_16137/m.11650 type:complete len:200 (+) Transcript_16137:618-1217(+)|eukprot:CAMPEP_0202980570 /NCGR_PEP_ID=MMETSP1396-20130829/86473_1 /ASSEMBLY_ACC=CAM_ASM_000872 /TAXON_ID= /ORGANISM="Pseudokeronopsis sp., Strain Brazil" /LENGTH=199 /DNA_ID=CAMNT_0049720641 /DNA_START=1856 /DNA_END=2458 /DNA_ORIENTATION=+